MPFTPSHAVIALPFVRSPLIPAAIAVGAMTPDLPLFVRGLGFDYGRTHSLAWMPATIALALVLLLVWRCVLRPATRELAPRAVASRLPEQWDDGARAGLRETFAITGDPARVSWRGILILVVSLAIGVASHIVWDLFTHEGRWGSQILPVLDQDWGPMAGYKWLQHGSSVIGMVILAIWALLWLRGRSSAELRGVLPPAVRWSWWASLPVILVAAWLWGLAAYGPLTAEWTSAHLAYRVLPPACAAWGVLTLVLCVVVQAVRSRAIVRRS